MNNEPDFFPGTEDRPSINVFKDVSIAQADISTSEPTIDLPKYYPEEHELTKWMINQMRRRNGLHHLVNFANAHPLILASYFELRDQPDKYISTKDTSCFSAYSPKTILFLTPLAMAIYFGCKSVIRILLDDTGTRLHTRTRNNVDINALCFAKRFIPKHGISGCEDYFTTSPAVLALRREFYTGLNLLSAAGYDPHDRIRYVDHISSVSQKTYWTTDLMEYALRLMMTRPGFDIVRLIQYLTYTGPQGKCAYDVMTYDVYTSNDSEKFTPIWFSLFRRICRRGISPAYVNCSNRLIDVLEILIKMGFFKQKLMPHGPAAYTVGPGRNTIKRHQLPRRVTELEIRRMTSAEVSEAMQAIAVDRDECFSFMVIWLIRMRSRCLTKPFHRLTDVFLTGLVDTQMLENFFFPPADIDPRKIFWPEWIDLGLNVIQQVPNTNWKSCQEEINIFGDDVFDMHTIEPQQVHDLRVELKKMACIRGLIEGHVSGRPRGSKKTPVSVQSPTPRAIVKAVTSSCKDETATDHEEAKYCGDVSFNSSSSVAPRQMAASVDRLNQMASEEPVPKGGHRSRAVKEMNRSKLDASLATRPKTTFPGGDRKSTSRRRPRSAKTPSPKPVLAVVKQKTATLSPKDSTETNSKSKPRPRWRL